jgi:glycolate oxidase FAD binding subunit
MGGVAEFAAGLAAAARERRAVRFVGGGTKLGWGRAVDAEVEISTAGLDGIVEHNEGDLTAVLEAGVPFARAQKRFASAGQMIALDPPLRDEATVGGVFATGDSGPLRARFRGPRDLIVGMTVALPDGSVAKAGGKVIKNVAGYDLAKLFTGSFGTLGAILQVAVRLHPTPEETATAIGTSEDLEAVAAATSAVAHSPLEYHALDIRLEGGRASALARFGGVAPRPQAEAAARLLGGLETEIASDDDGIWVRQREGQRSAGGTVVRVSGLPTGLPALLVAARRHSARVVGRAGLGLSWIALEGRGTDDAVAAIEELRGELSPAPCVVLDAPAEVRERVDPWGPVDDAAARLMARVKERFDPGGACNPGVFAGGI